MLQDLVVAIRLVGVKPRVSRWVQVSASLGLHRFHQLIQVVMGWEDTAPHLWRGSYDDFGDLRQFVPPTPLDERKATVVDLFTSVGDIATYLYDFDAQWTHELRLVDFVAAKPVPILMEGTGACPPERIEGAYAYEQFKLALKDRSHPFWKIDSALMRSFQQFNPKQFPQQQAAKQLEQLTSSWQRKRRRKPVVPSRSLVVIDNEPIRRRYRQELDQARAELHKLESELERFKGDDTNAFKGWLYTTFPLRLSRMRELHEETARLVGRLNLMREFQNHGVKAPGAAYHRAVRVETGEDPMPDFPPPRMAHRNSDSDEERKFLRAAIKGLAEGIGLDGDSIEDELDTMLAGSEEGGESPGREGSQEFKSIYRQIALHLHPDRGGTMTELEAQIWHRAQEAYAARDVLTLRQLWSRVVDQGEDVSQLSCGDMIVSTIETQAQIAALHALRASLKREPAWNFSRLTAKQLRSRQARVEKNLIEQEESVREELDDLRAECERFSGLQQRWNRRIVDWRSK
jgi:Plasmid pRiA4b ORF-3-like protein